ncbi:hypothetical protein G6F71_006616 [Rhizopus microsporus]|nr:hypothetical protein G6F71_006616 [Rhizopus microsporus]
MVSVIGKGADRLRTAGRGTSELYNEIRYIFEEGGDQQTMSTILEKARKLAEYYLATGKELDRDAKDLSTKAFRLPGSLKYLEDDDEDDNKDLFLSLDVIEKIQKTRFEESVIKRSRYSSRPQGGFNDEFDKKWMRESIVRMSELFLDNNELELNDFSEADLLHDVWPFLYRAFKNKEVRASLGERTSGAVALARNEHRGLEAREKRSRKAIGAKLDIVFKIGYNEHGSCEVGKDDVTVADDKYLDDDLIKLPKTLRDMLVLLVQKNPRKINNLLTVGFLVMGLCMELVIMDVPVGQHIARITKTARFEFPSSIETMTIDFLPFLEITWKDLQSSSLSRKILIMTTLVVSISINGIHNHAGTLFNLRKFIII